jgi:hypothetical protein
MRQFPHVPNSNVAPIQLPAPDFVVKGNSGNLGNGKKVETLTAANPP